MIWGQFLVVCLVAKTCNASWPTFENVTSLLGDAQWKTYFESVYGEIPASGYPIDISQLWMLWNSKLPGGAPASVGTCPLKNAPSGQHYDRNNVYSPPGTSWIWQSYPYTARPANSFAEVVHKRDPFGDEHYGAWLLYAPGSGIWYDIGQTLNFAEHAEAYQHFGVNSNEDMCIQAVLKGYSTLQFTAHVDHVNYPCDSESHLKYMNLEIVAVKLAGTYTCGAYGGTPSTIRAGWKHSNVCFCDANSSYLNCGAFAPAPAPSTPVHPVYRCYFTDGDPGHFSTLTTNCEGAPSTRMEGISVYLASKQVSGTHPVYRCLGSDGDHYDSVQSDCEGQGRNEGMLGYAWDSIGNQTAQAGIPWYRCYFLVHHMSSTSPTCEGRADPEAVLGYVVHNVGSSVASGPSRSLMV